jgi:type II secretory pathway pseudopilin PulG
MQSCGHNQRNKTRGVLERVGLARAERTGHGGRVNGRRARRVAGFTLLEIIVAVGAIAVISVGVASILNAVGKTVTAGRRTSNLTQYAALVESQMRADFEAMTREGFLVIRNQNVDVDANGVIDANDVVALSENDTRARIRRADEIIFFVRGGTEAGGRLEPQSTSRRTYASQRVPVLPDLATTSNAARIYYGHGRRARPVTGTGSFQYSPTQVGVVDGDPDARLGADVADNPNRFASSWTLLRHLLVLSPQGATARGNVVAPIFGIDPATPAGQTRLADSDSQVNLQPAAASIFRAINRVLPENTLQNDLFRSINGATTGPNNPNRPHIGTGLIDVATTTLEEIRSIVTTFPEFPSAVTQASDLEAWTPSIEALYPNFGNGTYPGMGASSLDRQHAWMRDAWPTQSLSQALCFQSEPDNQIAPYSRMRYELEPKDLVPVLAQPAADVNAQRERAALRADQLILTASNFVPRCSEFIVEWTFGQIDEQGEMIWHGLWRRADLDGDGTVEQDEWVTRPYPLDREGNLRFARRPAAINSPFALAADDDLPAPYDVLQRVPTRLIHGNDAVEDPNTEFFGLDSFFGYSDPTLPRDLSVVIGGGSLPNDSNGDGDPFNDLGDLVQTGDVGKWPWPTLIRVTVTLSDPQTPTIESTFQYTFTTPKD